MFSDHLCVSVFVGMAFGARQGKKALVMDPSLPGPLNLIADVPVRGACDDRVGTGSKLGGGETRAAVCFVCIRVRAFVRVNSLGVAQTMKSLGVEKFHVLGPALATDCDVRAPGLSSMFCCVLNGRLRDIDEKLEKGRVSK